MMDHRRISMRPALPETTRSWLGLPGTDTVGCRPSMDRIDCGRAGRSVPWRVVKVGGSLWELRDLVSRVRSWLMTQSPALNLLVVGGGPAVDAIRRASPPVDDGLAHEQSLAVMDENAQRFADCWAVTRIVRRLADLREWQLQSACTRPPSDALRVVEPRAMLDDLQRSRSDHAPLPVGWHVTSDSVAAYFARGLNAAELVLLKSCWPDAESPVGGFPKEATREGRSPATARADTAPNREPLAGDARQRVWQAWVRQGYVDAYFPVVAAGIPWVRCVNLRAVAPATRPGSV